MKVTVITVVYNGEKYLEECIESVLAQDYSNLEYVLIDGGSTDGTSAILDKYRSQIDTLVSESDKGIYDAMNKGLQSATGEVVGFLNADDFFTTPTAITTIAKALEDSKADCAIGNLLYVQPEDTNKVTRLFTSEGFTPRRMLSGDMPPHETFYARKSCYDKLGNYKTDYKITGDFELILRFLYIQKLTYTWVPGTYVKMRMGGVSSDGIKSNLALNKEILRACRENGVKTSLPRIYTKYFRKIWQFFGN